MLKIQGISLHEGGCIFNSKLARQFTKYVHPIYNSFKSVVVKQL